MDFCRITATLLLLLSLSVSFSIASCSSRVTSIKGVNLESPAIDITPTPLSGFTSSAQGSKLGVLCERVQVAGISRFMLRSYASGHKVTLASSVVIPEKLQSRIQICFHRNASLGLCQCEKDDWKVVQNGLWTSVKSPYEERYIDVKFIGDVSGSVTVTVEEEFQRWRLFCLGFGFVLLLLAPVVSSWVPFYYSSSMAIGVLLVIIILLFQGMKLLPTGRKSAFYLTVYGSVLGAGSFLLHHFSMLISSILVNFGLSEEMHNPVSVFVLVGIVLAGAGLGFWIVRKFIVLEDGSVDLGVVQFVKWAMRFIAVIFIFQSTLDTPLAAGALVSYLAIYFTMTHINWYDSDHQSYFENGFPWSQTGVWTTRKRNRAEFLSRPRNTGHQTGRWDSPRSGSLSDSPVQGLFSPPTGRKMRNQQDYYSTFHNTPTRKKYNAKEWEEFTQVSTRLGLRELASSPDFTDWMMKNADRIKLHPDVSSDESVGSGSDSTDPTDEYAVNSGNRLVGLFKW